MPEDQEIQARRETIRRQLEERRRAQEMATALAEIEEHLEQEELHRARRLLDLTVARYGEAEPLLDLGKRIEKLRLRAQVATLVDEARLLVEAEEFEGALKHLDQALELTADT